MDELAQIIRIFGCIQILISSIVLICLLVLIVGILKSNKQTRNQPFNAYVIGLELSDLAMNVVFLASSVWYLINAADGDDDLSPTTIKRFWTIIKTILIFTTASNMWLNGIVGYHVFNLLKSSHMARHCDPPTIKRVIIETLLVYVFVGLLSYFYYCLSTNEFDSVTNNLQTIHAGILLFVTIFGPLFPMIYISYITIRIYKQSLLPITGRTRTIVIYFGRIVIVFFVFYLPGSIFFAIGTATKKNWCRNIGIIFFSLQGGFSFVVALKKPDIYDAVVINFLLLRKKTTEYNNNNNTDITARATTTTNKTDTDNRPSNQTIPLNNISRIEKKSPVTINNNNNNHDDDDDDDDDIEVVVEKSKTITSSSLLPGETAAAAPPSTYNSNNNNNNAIIIGGNGLRREEEEEEQQQQQVPSLSSPEPSPISTTTHPSLKQQQQNGHYPDDDENDKKCKQSLLPPTRRSLSPPQDRGEGEGQGGGGGGGEQRSIENKKKKTTKSKIKTKTKSKTKASI